MPHTPGHKKKRTPEERKQFDVEVGKSAALIKERSAEAEQKGSERFFRETREKNIGTLPDKPIKTETKTSVSNDKAQQAAPERKTVKETVFVDGQKVTRDVPAVTTQGDKSFKGRIEAGFDSFPGQTIREVGVLGSAASPGAFGALQSSRLAGFIRGQDKVQKGLSKLNAQGIKQLITSKAFQKIVGTAIGTDVLGAWLASDNIITGTGFFINSVVEGVETGRLTKDEAFTRIDEAQGFKDSAERFVRISGSVNPLLIPFKKLLLINADIAQGRLDDVKDQIEFIDVQAKQREQEFFALNQEKALRGNEGTQV